MDHRRLQKQSLRVSQRSNGGVGGGEVLGEEAVGVSYETFDVVVLSELMERRLHEELTTHRRGDETGMRRG